jgi:hypothetical protein
MSQETFADVMDQSQRYTHKKLMDGKNPKRDSQSPSVFNTWESDIGSSYNVERPSQLGEFNMSAIIVQQKKVRKTSTPFLMGNSNWFSPARSWDNIVIESGLIN